MQEKTFLGTLPRFSFATSRRAEIQKCERHLKNVLSSAKKAPFEQCFFFLCVFDIIFEIGRLYFFTIFLSARFASHFTSSNI